MKLRRTLDQLWHTAVPFAGCALLLLVRGEDFGWGLLTLAGATLIAAVLVAVHHAEVIALRVGEPFGTLVLALAVTVIEVALIVALMLSDPAATSALARDTVFAAVMIICNGVVGLCLLMGAARHHVLAFRVEGTSPSLSVLATLATLILVIPTVTSSTPGPTLSPAQLVFAAAVSLTLYLVFIFVQTVRHREYFLPMEVEDEGDARAPSPSDPVALASLGLLFVALVAVVGLAKSIAPDIEAGVQRTGVPHATVGIAVALMVLAPETWAAVRAARRNRMQTS
ncbi:MAG: calcium:proton antiporter, partial [Gammaproteobacteria bacterium]